MIGFFIFWKEISDWFIDSLNDVWTIFNFYHSFIYFSMWNVWPEIFFVEGGGGDCTIATINCQVLDRNVLINFLLINFFHPF